jgi:conjugative relaxase-like TrwC/TraI family protein
MALTITMSKSAAAAKRYFSENLQRSDYFSQGGERPGLWVGQGTERLGLEGEVTAKAFCRLADNKNPNTGKRLTVRDVQNARPGYDFTFSGPKTLAALWAYTGDQRYLDALKDSILETAAEDIEPEMKTRLRRGGQDSNVITGNAVGSLFLHDTTRPLKEDRKPDPHPHGHLYLFNRTWAPHENRWQAAQLGDLHLDRPYLEAAFEARLGQRLLAMGLPVVPDGKGSWTIDGVPQSVLDKYSRRAFELLAEAEKRGITDPAEKAKLASKYRLDKDAGEKLTTPDLHAYWKSRLTDDEAAALAAVVQAAHRGGQPQASTRTAAQAIDHALAHFFGPDGRNSAESEKAIMEEALRYGAGAVLPADVKRELARRDLIRAEIKGRIVMTTPEVHAEEQALVKSAWSGRSSCEPLAAGKPYVPGKKVDGEQAAAVGQLIGSQDLALMLIGKSGAGKTTTLTELDTALRERGRKLMAFAPTVRASRKVLRSKGFAMADTLANLLRKPELQKAVRGQVLMIDEAGQAGTRAMRQVFALVEQQRAEGYDTRILLVGDPQQHRGVPRGQVLNILQDQAGLMPARLNTIRRQEDPGHRLAVELASEGKAGEAFDQLDRMGKITEIEDAGERYQQLAKEYVDTLVGKQTAMIIAPTHAEGKAVVAAVRAELRTREMIGAEDHRLVRYESKDLTEAQRKDAAMYQPGDTIQWGQHAPGFKKGEKVTVLRREGGQVRVAKADGQVKELPLALADRFEVYRTTSIDVAEHEKIRITRNGTTADKKPHALNNGDVITVRHITEDGDLIDDRGWTIPASYGHLASGVVTSHASQGDEADVSFVAQSGTSRGASSAAQWYVSIGRGSKGVRVFTEDKEALRSAVARSETARSAAEVWEASQRQRQAEQQARRKAWWQRRQRGWAERWRQQAARKVQKIVQAVQHRPEHRGLGHAQQ